MPSGSEFSKEVTRAVFLAPMVSAVTLPVFSAACEMSRVGFSRRDCLKLERNIMDRIAATRDGLLMLEIASYGQRALTRCT